jgi:hypothetical protein
MRGAGCAVRLSTYTSNGVTGNRRGGERIFCVAYRSENTLFRHGTGWSNDDSVVRNRAHVGAVMPWLCPAGCTSIATWRFRRWSEPRRTLESVNFSHAATGTVLRQLAEEMFLFDGDQIAWWRGVGKLFVSENSGEQDGGHRRFSQVRNSGCCPRNVLRNGDFSLQVAKSPKRVTTSPSPDAVWCA